MAKLDVTTRTAFERLIEKTKHNFLVLENGKPTAYKTKSEPPSKVKVGQQIYDLLPIGIGDMDSVLLFGVTEDRTSVKAAIWLSIGYLGEA